MDRPTIICLTPVKNEAWILERFLKCASVWADHIIVADQGSDDGSQEIARRFSKVTLIENPAREFNEPERQKLLIDAARKIPGPRLLVALDADEFLTADFSESREWDFLLHSPPGTIINFQWACILPDRQKYYVFPADFPLGFMDDGSKHRGEEIHSPRLPLPSQSPRLTLREIKVMHFSVVDDDRFRSKVRWYQCIELLKNRWAGRHYDLYRWYHRDFHVPESSREHLPDSWISGYGKSVDLLSIPKPLFYRWDAEILRLFEKYGCKKFRRLAIWDVDWKELHMRIYGSKPPSTIRDPRSWIDRFLHRWLERTQPFYCHYSIPTGRIDRLLERTIRKGVKLIRW